MGCGPRSGGQTLLKRSFDTPQKKFEKKLAPGLVMGDTPHTSQEVNKYMNKQNIVRIWDENLQDFLVVEFPYIVAPSNEELAQAGVRISNFNGMEQE
jgi:hypothetical protein